jgi:uncharacterized membrane protein
MSSWWFRLMRFSRRPLVRAGIYGLLAVAAALAAAQFAWLVPDELGQRLGGEAVENILSALASSLLAVATFSVSAVVVAYTAASAQVTPRAAAFITTDGGTQRALATFVGAFLFAVVALVALGADYYGRGGRTILFLATLLMVIIVAVTLLGWIDRVLRLAQYHHLIGAIEERTRKAIDNRLKHPSLGGEKLERPSEEGFTLESSRIGYVANIDPNRLHKMAERLECTVEILVMPGAFVRKGEAVVRLPGVTQLSEHDRKRLQGAFDFSESRTFEQDPRYGLQVLVEIAARALSPGVNDPGTAVLVTDACYRLLAEWAERKDERVVARRRLKAPELDGCSMIAESLGEIGRYGAKDAAVASRVQSALGALAGLDRLDWRTCAREEAALALKRAEQAISFAPDAARVRAASRS